MIPWLFDGRRTHPSIRYGVLFAMAMALGKMDTLKASGGQLTCPLDQWDHVTFTYRGKTVTMTVAEVFAALQGGIK
jgi:hypothetical protein